MISGSVGCNCLHLFGKIAAPPENVLCGRRRLWKDWGERLEPTKQSRQLGLSFHATGCSKRGSSFRERIPCTCSQAIVLSASARFYCPSWQSVPSSSTKLDESSTEGADSRKEPLIRLKRTTNEFSEPRLNSF